MQGLNRPSQCSMMQNPARRHWIPKKVHRVTWGPRIQLARSALGQTCLKRKYGRGTVFKVRKFSEQRRFSCFARRLGRTQSMFFGEGWVLMPGHFNKSEYSSGAWATSWGALFWELLKDRLRTVLVQVWYPELEEPSSLTGASKSGRRWPRWLPNGTGWQVGVKRWIYISMLAKPWFVHVCFLWKPGGGYREFLMAITPWPLLKCF